MLARHFPPIGGAGVHRTVGSVRHLPAHGYHPVVITGTAQHRDRWEPRDDDLYARLPTDVPVHRVAPRASVFNSRLAHLGALPPHWVRSWVAGSAQLGIEVGRDARLIYTSCAPYETAFAGARVGKALRRPWIADLEDPWALDDMRVPFSRVHRAVDLRLMRRALATASAVVTAAPEAAVRIRAAMPELASRIAVVGIPIGFELLDFPAGTPHRPDGIYRIVHTGSLHTDLGEHLRATRWRRRLLGGMAPGLDVLTRSHVFLVEALGELIASQPALGGRIELHLAGELTPEDRAVAAGRGFVRTPGLLTQRDAIALMRSADLLFLPMHDLPIGVRAGLIPYKTYEYLAAGRPILAAVPDGDVRDMLAPLPRATLVRPSDVGAMVDAVWSRMRVAALAPDGREPDVEPPALYERTRAVARIAEVLDGVIGRAPPPVRV